MIHPPAECESKTCATPGLPAPSGNLRFWLPDLLEAIVLAIVFSVLISLADEESRGPGIPEPPTERSLAVARGAATYDFRCYFCHGYSGDSKTLAASMLASPPRKLSEQDPAVMTEERIRAAISHGLPGTPMMPFSGILTPSQTDDLAAFVYEAIVSGKGRRPGYHTAENGWPDHERHSDAFAFATGAIDPSADPETLAPELRAGQAKFLSSCVTCHDRTGGSVSWKPVSR